METAWLEDFPAVPDEGGFSRAAGTRAVQAAKNAVSSASVSSGNSS
jgi:hypothetical protein